MSTPSTHTPNALVVTPHQFLADSFGARADDVRVGGFFGDPGDPGQTDWRCFRAADALGRLTTPDANGTPRNLYFCPFLMKGPRSAANFEAACQIPVDDVGAEADVIAEKARFTAEDAAYKAKRAEWEAIGGEEPLEPIKRRVKIAREPLIAMFGEPTLELVTSVSHGMSNSQFFYKLDVPCTDGAKVLALLRAIGSDAKDLARWVRMPGGANGKAALVSEHGAPFVSTLGEAGYDASRTFNINAMLEKAKVSSADVDAAADAMVGTKMDPDAPVKPEFRALERAGLILGKVSQGQATERAYWIECPGTHQGEAEGGWLGDTEGHTPGLDDRAKVWEHGGFQCHHGHCMDKNFNDLAEWVAKNHASDLDAVRREHAKDAFDEVEDDGVQTSVSAPTKASAKPIEWRDFLAGATGAKRPARRSICSYLVKGEVTVLASQPGVGKSLFAVATAGAISTDKPGFVGELGFARSGSTIYVSNEDPADVVDARREAWTLGNELDAGDFKHRGLVAVLDTPLRVITRADRHSPVKTTTQLDQIGELIARKGDVCLVMLDTATTVFENIEENDNGAQGAAYALLGAWARRHDVAVLILNHMPKATGRAGGGGDLGSIRGASAIGGSVRRALTLVELPDNEKDRLRDQDQRHEWVILQGAKSTNDKPGAMGKRYFRRRGEDVSAWDEHGNEVKENVGWLKYEPTGPDFGFNPASEEARFRVCEVIARMYRSGAALRVNISGGKKGGTGLRKAAAVLADEIIDADEASAARATREAIKRELVEEVEGPRDPDTHRKPKVYRTTALGDELVERRQREALMGDGDETTTAQPAVNAKATVAVTSDGYEGPEPVLPAGVGLMDALGDIDIDFGAAQ